MRRYPDAGVQAGARSQEATSHFQKHTDKGYWKKAPHHWQSIEQHDSISCKQPLEADEEVPALMRSKINL
eukprot:1158561-Pelagomonas_calceolata.AAC.4